jgi:hypothetical protein
MAVEQSHGSKKQINAADGFIRETPRVWRGRLALAQHLKKKTSPTVSGVLPIATEFRPDRRDRLAAILKKRGGHEWHEWTRMKRSAKSDLCAFVRFVA